MLILIHSRGLSKNHYDVLKLSRNCTNKDVRQAFLKLTKEVGTLLNKLIVES